MHDENEAALDAIAEIVHAAHVGLISVEKAKLDIAERLIARGVRDPLCEGIYHPRVNIPDGWVIERPEGGPVATYLTEHGAWVVTLSALGRVTVQLFGGGKEPAVEMQMLWRDGKLWTTAAPPFSAPAIFRDIEQICRSVWP